MLSKTLRVLGSHRSSRSIQTSENNRYIKISSRHVKCLRSRIIKMTHCLKSKVPSHVLYNRSSVKIRSPNSKTSKPSLCNRSIYNSFRSKDILHSLGNLISPLILSNFFTHKKHRRIPMHLFYHSLSNSLSYRNLTRLNSTKKPLYFHYKIQIKFKRIFIKMFNYSSNFRDRLAK